MKIAIAFCCLMIVGDHFASGADLSQGELVLKMAEDFFAFDEHAKKEKKTQSNGLTFEDGQILLGRGLSQGYFLAVGQLLISCDAIDPPQPISISQFVAVIQAYVKENPKQWSRPRSDLIQDALIDAWPGPNAEKFKALRAP